MTTETDPNAPPPGGSSSSGTSGGSSTSGTTGSSSAPNGTTPPGGLEQAVLGLSNLYRSGEVSPQITDAVTQALVLILGSGPALGAYQGLLQAQNANGLMYHNAVANQQKATMLGMALTAKCVRYMVDPDCHALDDLDELEEEILES